MNSMIRYGMLQQTKKNKNLDTKIMKAKYALIALIAVTFFGCDDNTAGLGLGMFPGSDQGINGKLTPFEVTTSSVETGRIYAKTNIGYVGKFTDATFGTYNAGFLATLNCPDHLTFPALYTETEFDSNGKATKATGTMVKEAGSDIELIYNDANEVIGNIHTVELYLWYSSYFGDSLTACRLSVYELNKKLDAEHAYYTDIDPDNYYKANGAAPQLLGTKAYTAVDLSVKDSIRNLSTYVPSVHLNLDKEVANRVGKKILKASRIAGSNFNNLIFSKEFPGIYVKSDYGDGTVLYIDQVQMNVVYKCYAVGDNGVKLKKTVKEKGDTEFKDSTYYSYRPFASTREVIQANNLQNDKVAIENCINSANGTYLKSPAGIFTQAVLPIKDIEEKLKGDTLNAVKLTFSSYNQSSDKKFGMSIPTDVMLIRKKNKDSFFKNNDLNNGVSSFLASHKNNQYTFSNITKLINDCLAEREEISRKLAGNESVTITTFDEKGNPQTVPFTGSIEEWEKVSDWDKVVLIPVLVTYDSSSNSGYGTSSNIISIQHDLKPGYVRLKGGKDENKKDIYLKLEVVSTSFASTKSK